MVRFWTTYRDACARYSLRAAKLLIPRSADTRQTDMCYFYNDLSVYEGFGGTVLAKEEGRNLAQALGPKNKNLILQNHGYVYPYLFYTQCPALL